MAVNPAGQVTNYNRQLSVGMGSMPSGCGAKWGQPLISTSCLVYEVPTTVVQRERANLSWPTECLP